MQDFEQEYIENMQAIATSWADNQLASSAPPFEAAYTAYEAARARRAALTARNMELLQTRLFPLLMDLYQQPIEVAEELEAFADRVMQLASGRDVGLSEQIFHALVPYARKKRDTTHLIRWLYKLGLSRFYLYRSLYDLDSPDVAPYVSRMRLCFVEASAYLQYFDHLEDDATRSYVLRSLSNTVLGPHKTVNGRIDGSKRALQVLQDESYRQKAPSLPWDTYVNKTRDLMLHALSPAAEDRLSVQNVEDLLDTAYLFYEKQLDAARAAGRAPNSQNLLPYYSIEYRCGVRTLEQLIELLEQFLDRADPDDYSPSGLREMLLLPAFYMQYLRLSPALIPPRNAYIGALQRRILRYLDHAPKTCDRRLLHRQLSQTAGVYLEVDGGVPFLDFLLHVMRFTAPEVYIHSYIVGRVAMVLCEAILEQDAHFFDDLPFLADTTATPEARRSAILTYARIGGELHDCGRLGLMPLYTLGGRQWLDEEYRVTQFHTQVGYSYLSTCPSTRSYADIALGHHRWYDGSQGYSIHYKRGDSPYRQMVDVIMVSDWLASVADPDNPNNGDDRTLDEAVHTALTLEGKRFSPLVTAFLREPPVVDRLRELLGTARADACRSLYGWYRRESAT
jgi:hypothetical protein